MDGNPLKNAAQWFYSKVYRDQSIRPRKEPPKPAIPSPIRAARALESGSSSRLLTREALFLHQARLLAGYEDNFPETYPVTYYYPTYQSLSDPELRSYFTWRTRLRRGELQKTSPTFVFLYVFELLNQVGVADPLDGYWRLRGFQAAYSQADSYVSPYLEQWLTDYVIYYGLHPSLLEDTAQVQYDRCITVFTALPGYSNDQIMDTVHQLASQWLDRSKFYRENRADCDSVICNVLRGMYVHYGSRCKRNLTDQIFGTPREYTVRLFQDAVFCGKQSQRSCEYTLDPLCVYRCRHGAWTVNRYGGADAARQKLNGLMKAIDGIMREGFGYEHPVKYSLDLKWQLKLIREEVQRLVDAKRAEEEARQAAEKAKLKLDMSRLAQIRQDAAVTRDRLIVEEEAAEEEPLEAPAPQPAAIPDDTPLDGAEYRLLQCLLYGRPLDWVRAEGRMLSVLTDSINEKLYDTFCDSVLEDGPAIVEDYIEDLKEMILP